MVNFGFTDGNWFAAVCNGTTRNLSPICFWFESLS